jgi:hypothetical protein
MTKILYKQSRSKEFPWGFDSLDEVASFIVSIVNDAISKDYTKKEERARRPYYMPSDDLTQHEIELLSLRRDNFKEHVANILKLASDHLDQDIRDKFDREIREAILATFRITQLAVHSPIVMRWAKERMQSQAAKARAAKPSNEMVDATIKRCIEQHLAAKPAERRRSPNSLAGSIETAVKAALSPDGKYTWSANAIAKRIRKLRTATQLSD